MLSGKRRGGIEKENRGPRLVLPFDSTRGRGKLVTSLLFPKKLQVVLCLVIPMAMAHCFVLIVYSTVVD